MSLVEVGDGGGSELLIGNFKVGGTPLREMGFFLFGL